MTTDQSHSHVLRDQIGSLTDNSDRRVFNTIIPSNTTAIAALTARLEHEVGEQLFTTQLVPTLSFYKKRKEAADGIIGLEAKLNAGSRGYLLEEALELKVEFDTILEKWSLYASAQEIFGHLLALISKKFSRKIMMFHAGDLPGYSASMLDEIVDDQILIPIVDQCGIISHFQVNLDLTLGMLYWLADNCFVKWHR